MLPEYNDRNRALEKIDEPLTQEFLDLSKIVKINTIATFIFELFILRGFKYL